MTRPWRPGSAALGQPLASQARIAKASGFAASTLMVTPAGLKRPCGRCKSIAAFLPPVGLLTEVDPNSVRN